MGRYSLAVLAVVLLRYEVGSVLLLAPVHVLSPPSLESMLRSHAFLDRGRPFTIIVSALDFAVGILAQREDAEADVLLLRALLIWLLASLMNESMSESDDATFPVAFVLTGGVALDGFGVIPGAWLE